MCGGRGLGAMYTQDLRDLFMIYSSAVELDGPGRDKQLGMLLAIREEINKRVEAAR